jgi:hypothetical protein
MLPLVSPREPAPTNTFTLTDSAVGTGVVTTLRPLLSSSTSQVIGMLRNPPLRSIGTRNY